MRRQAHDNRATTIEHWHGDDVDRVPSSGLQVVREVIADRELGEVARENRIDARRERAWTDFRKQLAYDESGFGETFDGVLSWGLMFLLPRETQRSLIHRVGKVVHAGGRFLFTAPSQVCSWADLSTGELSVSLGRDAYISILGDAGFKLMAEYTDEGENHYYDAVRF